MNPTEVSIAQQLIDIGRQIAESRVQQSFVLTAAVAVLAISIAMLLALLKGYADAKGKIKAANANFENAVEQLRRTTEEAERIKVRIAHQDWATKEYRSVKRGKLEEMMKAAYTAIHSLTPNMRFQIDDRIEVHAESRDAMGTVEMIAALYFEELRTPVQALVNAMDAFHTSRVKSQSSIQQELSIIKLVESKIDRANTETLKAELEACLPDLQALYHKAVDSYVSEFEKRYPQCVAAVTALEDAAAAIMRELLTKEPISG